MYFSAFTNSTGYEMYSYDGFPNSLKKLELSRNVQVYPNPTQGNEWQVVLKADHTAQMAVAVADITGRVVYSSNIPAVQGDNRFTIPAATPGVYTYRITAASGQLIGAGRLVKE